MSTQAEENYLKAIFKLSGKKKESVSTNAIAEELQTKASSVSDMVKKLSEKNLINYVKYKGVSLTKGGYDLAVNIVRKHRLWEVFLVNHLNFKWDEVHDIAEELEHIKSLELVNKLDAFLSHPNYDPHGDPIPDADLRLTDDELRPLSTLVAGERATIRRVPDNEECILAELCDLGMVPGQAVELRESSTGDGSLTVAVSGQEQIVSVELARQIGVA